MLGIDVVEVRRIREMERLDAFLERICAPEEIAYIGKEPVRAAGVWAAKEAVAKAFGTGFSGLSPREIRILHTDRGAPYAEVRGERVFLSVSHEREYAVAVAMRAAGGERG